jgi:putative ABC transport system ATP-binding protein
MVYPASTPGAGPGARALDAVDLDVLPGESVAVMGASGSGKTTLLHLLAGILRPTSGTVTLETPAGPVGVHALDDAERSRLRREQLGFVFQQGLLLDELTALENVAVALMLNGVPRAAASAQASQWLAALGLVGLEDRRLGALSGGQAQRVAIARAQVTGARLLFADEPTGALDSRTGAEVLDLLLAAVAQGRTLVVVTHDAGVAARCDRVVTLSDGRIVADARRAADAGVTA